MNGQCYDCITVDCGQLQKGTAGFLQWSFRVGGRRLRQQMIVLAGATTS